MDNNDESIRDLASEAAHRRMLRKTQKQLRILSLFSVYFIYLLIKAIITENQTLMIIYTISLTTYIALLLYLYYKRDYSIKKNIYELKGNAETKNR